MNKFVSTSQSHPYPWYLNANAMPIVATHSRFLSKSQAHFSGAPGNLSMTYFPLATLIMGTPGTFLTLLLRSLSRSQNINLILRNPIHQAIIRIYVDHTSSVPTSSLAIRNAILYLRPSFSSSAMTHEVIIGDHFAKRQSIMDSRRGSLHCTVWERKFVS
jgi:hypothetical protein